MEKNTWKVDPAHSRVGFKIKHLGIADVSGYFSDFTVEVSHSEPDYSDIAIEVKINAASINTGIEMRDNHLRSADFFDVEKHPQITFSKTKIEKLDENKGRLSGELTLLGITKPIELDTTYYGTVTNPMTQEDTVGFKITGNINRKDFALGTGFESNFIADKVNIVVDAEFSPGKQE